MKNKRWSLEEDAILTRNVIDNYDNLEGVAFPKTAIEIERSTSACSQRWYNVLRHQSLCFALLSEKKAMKNRKTLPKNYSEQFLEVSKKKSKLKELISKVKLLFRHNA